jgi:hypothetical protein
VAAHIATGVGLEAQRDGVAPKTSEAELHRRVAAAQWGPAYPSVCRRADAPKSMIRLTLSGASEEWREGTGRVVHDEALQDRALAVLQRKYGWQLSVTMLVYRLRGLYRDRVVLELTPAART